MKFELSNDGDLVMSFFKEYIRIASYSRIPKFYKPYRLMFDLPGMFFIQIGNYRFSCSEFAWYLLKESTDGDFKSSKFI